MSMNCGDLWNATMTFSPSIFLLEIKSTPAHTRVSVHDVDDVDDEGEGAGLGANQPSKRIENYKIPTSASVKCG